MKLLLLVNGENQWVEGLSHERDCNSNPQIFHLLPNMAPAIKVCRGVILIPLWKWNHCLMRMSSISNLGTLWGPDLSESTLLLRRSLFFLLYSTNSQIRSCKVGHIGFGADGVLAASFVLDVILAHIPLTFVLYPATLSILVLIWDLKWRHISISSGLTTLTWLVQSLI